MLGDSHAIDLFGIVTSSNSSTRVPFIIGLTKGGCRPHTPLLECQYDGFNEFLISYPNVIKGVIYEQAGFYLLKTKNKKGEREMFSKIPLNDKVEGIHLDYKNIELTYQYLLKISDFVEVIWFGPRVEPHINSKAILKLGCDYPFKLRNNTYEVFDMLDDHIEDYIKKDNNRIKFSSQNREFKYSFPTDFVNCNEIYWSDGDHLSSEGEKKFGERFNIFSSFINKSE